MMPILPRIFNPIDIMRGGGRGDLHSGYDETWLQLQSSGLVLVRDVMRAPFFGRGESSHMTFELCTSINRLGGEQEREGGGQDRR